jgi:hypothetical protein
MSFVSRLYFHLNGHNSLWDVFINLDIFHLTIGDIKSYNGFGSLDEVVKR